MKKKNNFRDAEIAVFDFCTVLLKNIKTLEEASEGLTSNEYRPLAGKLYDELLRATATIGVNILNDGIDIDPENKDDQQRFDRLYDTSVKIIEDRLAGKDFDGIQ